MIPLLQPIFRGEWAPYGEALQCAARPPGDAWPVTALLHPARLGTTLRRYAAHLGVAGPDLRPVASAWSLVYLGRLLPPVVAAASLLHHRFPVAADAIAVRLHPHGEPDTFHITDEGHATPGDDTAARYAALLHGHLAPLFEALHRETRVARKILWGNTARHLEALFDQVQQSMGSPAPLQADRAHLLDHAEWPGGQANPMVARQCPQDRPGSDALHRQCCLYYRLPGQGYCGGCPLAPAHRGAVTAAAPNA